MFVETCFVFVVGYLVVLILYRMHVCCDTAPTGPWRGFVVRLDVGLRALGGKRGSTHKFSVCLGKRSRLGFEGEEAVAW